MQRRIHRCSPHHLEAKGAAEVHPNRGERDDHVPPAYHRSPFGLLLCHSSPHRPYLRREITRNDSAALIENSQTSRATRHLLLMELGKRLAALWESSPFRSGIHLTAAERADLEAVGLTAMAERARPLIQARLGSADPANDGRQTPR